MAILQTPKSAQPRHLYPPLRLLLACYIAWLVSALSAGAGRAAENKALFGNEYNPDHDQMQAFSVDEDYQGALEPLVIFDPFTYLQPWSGYCNPSNLPPDDAKRLSCQTFNLKTSLRYKGIEVLGNKWMRLACSEALKSAQHGGGPFSAVIVQIDEETGKVIRYWVSHNHVTEWTDPTAHGEVMAIRQACKDLGVINLGHITKDSPGLKLSQPHKTSHCEIYSSAEPCAMCYAAIRWARLSNIYFAATVYDAAMQGVNFSDEPFYAQLSLNYAERKKLGVNCYQCTVENSLDAFNHYKRVAGGKY